LFQLGLRERSFVYIKDAAKAIALSCGVKTHSVDIFNICGQRTMSVIYLAHEICKISGHDDLRIIHKKSHLKLARDSICAGNRAREVLDYKPETDFIEGLRETVLAYLGS